MNREFVKADTEKDKARFLQVLESANQRTAEKGEVQWLPCHLTAEAVFGEGVEPWMLLEEGVPAAVVLLVQEDPTFWPDKAGEKALYIHRLAVAKGFEGRGLAHAVLDFAAEYARNLGIPLLRLDCKADRQKLRQVYEAWGFRFVDLAEADVPGEHLCNARYEFTL